jgi:lipopolysaccharide transport system permease protein
VLPKALFAAEFAKHISAKKTTKYPSMQRLIIIEPNRQERHYWLDLWRYRELFRILAWRDLSVRYKQTVIGALWALIRPVLTTVVFTIIFGRIAQLPSDGSVPYALMVLAGMLPWTFLSTGISDASNSLINDTNLISKVYFPRLIVPTATIVVAFADFIISFFMMIVLMAWYKFLPSWHIILLPAFVLAAFLATLGPALWISALNVRFRDFRYVIPFIVQFGMYISPVGFSSSVIPEQWRLVYYLNPMVGIIDGFRWCILGGQSRLHLPGLALGLSVMAFLFWFGIRRFRKMEDNFADLV